MATLDERLAALGAAIAAARTKLAAEQGFENVEIGDLLATINEDFEAVVEGDEAARHAQLDSIEARLAAVQAQMKE